MREVWRTSSKIMVVVMLCASVLSAAVGGLVLYQSSKVVEQNVYRNLELTADNYASIFSDSTEKVESTLEAYLSAINGTFDYSALYRDPDAYLKDYQDHVLVPLTKQFAVDNREDFLGIYFDFNPAIPRHLEEDDQTYGVWYLDRNLTGEIQRSDMELKKNFDPRNEEMGWYYDAVEAGTGVWSKPYVDVYTGYYMISHTVPVYYKGELIGVAGIDMTFDSVRNIIEKFKVFDTGYAFLMSSDYDVIVTAGKKDIRQNANLADPDSGYLPLIDTIEKGDSKKVFIGTATDGKVLSYGRMSNGYIFVIEVKSQEIFKDLNYIRTLVDTTILAGITLCAVIAYFLGRYLAKPVDEAQRRIHRLSCQDLQKDDRPVKFGRNSEGQKMLAEIEMIRTTAERLSLSLKADLYQEELAQEKLESAVNKLEIVLSRMWQNYEPGAGEKVLNDFHFEEGRHLFGQISDLLEELAALREKIKKLGGIYYLDENAAPFGKNNGNTIEGSLKDE